MKKIISSLSVRCFLMMLACLFATTNMAWAQEDQTGTKHTVTLNANSGTVTPATIECTEGEPFGNLPTPTRNGFTFAGWYKTPGQEATRIHSTTVYEYARFGEMIHARWTKKTATIVFIGLNGQQVGDPITISGEGGSFPDIPANTYGQNPSSDSKFFAGYYTRINGEGDRIYTGVPTADGHNELRPVTTEQIPFAAGSTTYLYAFETHVKHVTHWDYTYINSIEQTVPTWTNINQDDATTRIQYGKLTFMDNNNQVLKWIYFEAAGVTNLTGMTAALSTHTTTKGQFHLQLADATNAETQNGAVVIGSNITNGDAGYWNVYFTDEQLSHFTRYNFEPISNDQSTPAQNWIRTTDPVAHDTWFTFNGASDGNTADLPWTVKLTNLKVYPDYVIAKPLFWDGSKWEEISQLLQVDGVTCQKVEQHGEGEGSYATYTGSYPVWKNGSTVNYGYALGMVGFEVDGQKVYMNADAAGHFDPAYNSANTQVQSDNGMSEWNGSSFPEIIYTIEAPTIQVIRFLKGEAPGAELAGNTPEIVWGQLNQTIESFSTIYSATRPGYTFVGWAENDGATTAKYTTSYTFNGAKTLYPVWKDATAPVITPAKMRTCEETVDVTIFDNEGLDGLTVTVNGINQTLSGDKITLPIPSEVYVDYVIVATDKDGNSSTVTVRIYKEHVWHPHTAADPTKDTDGSKIDYTHCDQCNEYKDKDGNEISEEWVEQNIIPAKSVLVKTEDGGIETTRDWDDDVNGAVAKVTADQTYLKMTGDAEVTNSIIDTPAARATLDLNGQSLLVDGEAGIINGNSDVTLLLKDDGVTEYTNKSKVSNSPVTYRRTLFSNYQKGSWQALYLPFASAASATNVSDFGTISSVSITSTEARLSIDKNVSALAANTCYFVRATDNFELTAQDNILLPYQITSATVSSDYTIKGSLTNSDHVAQQDSQSFWVLTNSGKFNWANKNQHQRPYRWVIYAPQVQNSRSLTIVDIDDDPTGIESIDGAELDANAPIYNVIGVMMPAGKKLPSGLYISNGKKFNVK